MKQRIRGGRAIGTAVTAVGVLGAALTINVGAASAAAGDLDADFGTAGVTDSLAVNGVNLLPGDDDWEQEDVFNAVAVQSDGKIVAVGYTDHPNRDILVARYNTDGTLDTTFDTDGVVTTDLLGGSADYANAVAIQSDGSIVVAGYADAGPARVTVVRYTTTGALDASYGSGGVAMPDAIWGMDNYASGLALDANGKAVVVGDMPTGFGSGQALVLRFTTAGALDTSFNTLGYALLDLSSGQDQFSAVTVDSSNRIVAVGTKDPAGDPNFLLARYTPAGALDTTGCTCPGWRFDDVGGGNGDRARAVAVLADGKIVVGGVVSDGSLTQFGVVRYLEDFNSIDSAGFGTAGIATVNWGVTSQWMSSMAIQSNGKIVLAGSVSLGAGQFAFGVARMTPAGTLDTAFATDGTATTTLTSYYNAPNAIAIQSDGKIVVAGSTDRNGLGHYDALIVRYLGDVPGKGTLPPTGSNATPMLIVSVGMMACGAALVLSRRRRRPTVVSAR